MFNFSQFIKAMIFLQHESIFIPAKVKCLKWENLISFLNSADFNVFFFSSFTYKEGNKNFSSPPEMNDFIFLKIFLSHAKAPLANSVSPFSF